MRLRRPNALAATFASATRASPCSHPVAYSWRHAGSSGGSVWQACEDYATAESLRSVGESNRTVRPTAMNPSSSRGHTLFIVRFSKFDKHGEQWIPYAA